MEIVGWFLLIIWIIAIIASGIGIYILFKIEENEVFNKRK
jgi:hypothetical protein